MSGMQLAWFTTFLIGLGVVLMLVIVVALVPRTVRMLTARFHCPWRERNVTVRCLSLDGETPSQVISCTAFADPTTVACGAPCVGSEELRRAVRQEPVGAAPAD